MSRERKKAAALHEKMQILRSITHSHAVNNVSSCFSPVLAIYPQCDLMLSFESPSNLRYAHTSHEIFASCFRVTGESTHIAHAPNNLRHISIDLHDLPSICS
jgi:hypothetical protein